MYSSLKPWINVTYQIKPYTGRNGAGTKQFGTTVTSQCYPEAAVKLIVDASGAEVTSTTQLYVPGNEAIKVTDNVIFESIERPIKSINTFYRHGAPDIKVVYL